MNNDILQTALVAAYKAGVEIMKIYTDPASDFEVERKADNSPLTIADRKAQEVIMSYLKDTPYPVLSEEGRTIEYAERAAWQTLWIVDPLDGTKEFIKRNGEFTVNIALVTAGVPVMGVVYVPATNELYVGDETLGAYKYTDITFNEDTQALSYNENILPLTAINREGVVVVASRSHLSDETKAYIEQLRADHKQVDFISSGSSIKICLVAAGVADVYPRFAPTMEWDTAAGHAVARAAGVDIYQYQKNIPLAYNKEDLLNPWFIVE